jgi:hypothetical protein
LYKHIKAWLLLYNLQICLYVFGQQIKTVSRSEKTKFSNYFIVVHPGVPIIGNKQKAKPEIDFVEGCPDPIKTRILHIYNQAFAS